jgi:septal ring factor EnvC (AmiA/AmiB activator)
MTTADDKLREALEAKAQEGVAQVKGNAEDEIKSAVAAFKTRTEGLETRLEAEIRGKFINVALAVVAVVVSVLVGAMYVATKDVYGAVISLQKDVSSAHVVIREATKELDTTKSALVATRGEIDALKSSLSQQTEEVKGLKVQLKEAVDLAEKARRELASTTAEYERRLQTLSVRAK